MAYNEKSPRDGQPEQTEKRRSLPSINRVTLVGNTGADSQIHTTKDGRTFATFDVATSESWLDPVTRERRERTDWHKVGIYRKGLVSLAEQYLGKGSRVYVEGQLRNHRNFDLNTGHSHTNTEVAVTPRKGEMIIFIAKPPAENPEAGQNRAREPRADGARQPDARASNWDASGRRASRTVGEPIPPRTTLPSRRKS